MLYIHIHKIQAKNIIYKIMNNVQVQDNITHVQQARELKFKPCKP